MHIIGVSKEMQKASSHYASIDSHVIAPFVDTTRDWIRTLGLYRAVCVVNQTAVRKYQSCVEQEGGETRRQRSETIVQTTLAEIEHFHEEKKRVLNRAVGEMIDGMLREHQAIVEALKRAKACLDL